ncbi:hypothetical protein [Teredinibacter sp. KSP-S5-2]|uniref:hypothetical protein n=1 Tax=Teredinibacter sp. KSP-S5-2 TaxID=3034506 RepID=UPI0029344429|nr:hypothetical protein [Teredinibacter sp. KSP-S5-2]WNO09984.1 hypothetical protein P5V12_02245 [Teredinibacter sp. KSP-S5-2]
MRYLSLFLLVVSSFALSGDGADSEIRYELDLSINYSKYVMSPKDIEWSNKLVNRLGYEGDVLHFVLTDIVLVEANKKLSGKIYQSVENPGRYYVLTGDIGIDTKLGIIGNAGAGGYSMYSPKSKKFIVCFNCGYGIPVVRHSTIYKGPIYWYGSNHIRQTLR